MSVIDNLLDSVKRTITDHVQAGGHQGFDTSGLLGKITDLFGRHSESPDNRKVVPASQDPYGDPAGEGGSRPSQSMGDRKVMPATQDPYGDPADEPTRR